MGCWNGTCGVTQIAITYGDPCRLILLHEQPTRSDPGGFCYHIEDWAPRCIPIKGTYNDYGTIADFEDNLNALHEFEFQRLKGNWVEPPPDHHSASQEGFSRSLTWKGIIENVERDLGRISSGGLQRSLAAIRERPDLDKPGPFYKPRKKREAEILEAISKADWTEGFSDRALKEIAGSRASEDETRRKLDRMSDYVQYFDGAERSDITRIGMVLVHEDVYQTMVSKRKMATTWTKQPIGEGYRELIQGAVDGYKNLDAFVDAREKAKESGDEEAITKAFVAEMRARDSVFEAARSLDSGNVSVGIDYRELIRLIAEHESPAPLIDELVDFVCFDGAMGAMRKHYSPQGGKGSQDDERDLHIAVNEAVAGVFGKRQEEEQG